MESPSPNVNSLLELVLERAFPSRLDAATVLLGVCLGSTVVEMAWMGFEDSFTFFSPQSGLGFHSVTAAASGLVSVWCMFIKTLSSGRYQEKLYLDWSQTVSEKSQYNLAQPLIRRDPETKLITVNFDPQVRAAAPGLSCPPGHVPELWGTPGGVLCGPWNPSHGGNKDLP